jgi:SAM-dependent methyltransferase
MITQRSRSRIVFAPIDVDDIIDENRVSRKQKDRGLLASLILDQEICNSMPSTIPVPAWLKPLVVPCWNVVHRCAWVAYDYLYAAGHTHFELCTVCGNHRLMLYRRRIIPRRLVELWEISPTLAASVARKESCSCSKCGANLRARRLAQALLSLYPVGTTAAPARSLAQWVESSESRTLRVAEINRIDGLHAQLLRLPHLSSSDFHPGSEPGSLVEGVRSEDLMRLTYPDESFDLVLTSETLEHVPDLAAALTEIRRVLVPGGRHIFTIPQLPYLRRTFARAVMLPDGSIENRAPRICHPGGDVGYPVFTEFGADIPDIFNRAGFELQVMFGPNRDDDLAQVYVCRKPVE